MAENSIKDFVKRQTTPLTIGVPKPKTQKEALPETREEVRTEVPVQQAAPVSAAPAAEPAVTKGHVGRPKSDVKKVKVSLYIPAESKEKLVRIQHRNYRQSLNDLLLEAIADIIRKYEE